MAIAPPLTFVLSMSSFRSRATARVCEANASLASTTSMSSIVSPALASALRVAGIGPVPMIFGSTPADAQETSVAIGVRPSSSALALDMTTRAAAPSLMPEAFPAVTTPSFLNAGRSLFRPSNVVPKRGNSSCSNTIGSPLRRGMTTGTISSTNLPALMASSARFWLDVE